MHGPLRLQPEHFHPGGYTPSVDGSLDSAISHSPNRTCPEPVAHTAALWVSGRAAVLFSPMHNSMDKWKELVKPQTALASDNDIERVGRVWDTEGKKLL